MRIDAHHHLWRYSAEEYGWIDDSMEVLRRDYLPEELAFHCASVGVDGAVVVQARQTVEETEWLLALAGQYPMLKGVVGWADIAADDFPWTLEKLVMRPLFKGLRHVVQAEPDGFLDGPAFNRGIAGLKSTGLVYDILIHAQQLQEATRFVDRHPGQSFVLDHIAKPAIAKGEITRWSEEIRELAQRPHVTCKISGMVTEADWNAWTADSLKPYFDVVLEAFGPGRLMAGSDWPVLNVASRYEQWWQTIDGWLEPLSLDERAAIEGGTAVRVYGLNS
jgi:L-fuconolactonase